MSAAPPAGEQAQPVATLHDDGCFTWKRDEYRLKYDRQRAGWRMDVYAAAPAPSAQPLTWISVRDRIPQHQDGEDGLRVLVLTADHDFGGVQVHDIPASDFYAYDLDDDEPGTEVTKLATHWMWKHDAIAGATHA